MLVLTHGLQRSGSTLVFELVRAILEDASQAQTRLPSELLGHDDPVNFLDEVSVDTLERIHGVVGDGALAIKTHAAAAPDVVAHVEAHPERFPVVFVSYRDPRGIGLSLLDAGHRARLGLHALPSRPQLALDRLTNRNAYAESFANVIDHGDAIRVIAGSIERAATWLGCARAHACYYDDLVSRWDEGVEAIAKALGSDLTGAEATAAIEGRFTQLHEGRPERWREVLAPEMERAYREQLAGPFERAFGHAF